MANLFTAIAGGALSGGAASGASGALGAGALQGMMGGGEKKKTAAPTATPEGGNFLTGLLGQMNEANRGGHDGMRFAPTPGFDLTQLLFR